MKKAVVFIADGSEEIETLTPVDYLRRAGVEVSLVSVGTAGRTVGMAHGVSVNADVTLETYLSDSGNALPDAVVIPGGMPGASNIADSRSAVDFIRKMNDDGRLVCSICASPAIVLSKTGALEGKKWTCYPGMSGEAGAAVKTHVDGVPFVHDGNLITGRGPGASEQFSMEIVTALVGSSVAADIKKGSCQR